MLKPKDESTQQSPIPPQETGSADSSAKTDGLGQIIKAVNNGITAVGNSTTALVKYLEERETGKNEELQLKAENVEPLTTMITQCSNQITTMVKCRQVSLKNVTDQFIRIVSEGLVQCSSEKLEQLVELHEIHENVIKQIIALQKRLLDMVEKILKELEVKTKNARAIKTKELEVRTKNIEALTTVITQVSNQIKTMMNSYEESLKNVTFEFNKIVEKSLNDCSMEARRKRIGERLERHPNYKVLMKKLETIELTDAKFDEIVETSKKIELDIELDITKEVEQYRIQLGSAQQHFNQLIVNMQLEDNRMQLNDVFVMHKRIIGLYEQYLPTRLTSPESVKVIEVDDGVSAKAAAGGAGRFTAITQSSYLQLPVVDSAKSKGP